MMDIFTITISFLYLKEIQRAWILSEILSLNPRMFGYQMRHSLSELWHARKSSKSSANCWHPCNQTDLQELSDPCERGTIWSLMRGASSFWGRRSRHSESKKTPNISPNSFT